MENKFGDYSRHICLQHVLISKRWSVMRCSWIVGIQEHRLITTNPTNELWSDDKQWVLIYSTASTLRHGGVGILMSKCIYKCHQSVESISNRIITATFHGNPKVTVTSVYAPTECASTDDKSKFYSCLKDHLDQVKKHNIHLVTGDFNARVSWK